MKIARYADATSDLPNNLPTRRDHRPLIAGLVHFCLVVECSVLTLEPHQSQAQTERSASIRIVPQNRARTHHPRFRPNVLGVSIASADFLPTSPASGGRTVARVYKAHVNANGAQQWGVDYVDPSGQRIRRVVGNHQQAKDELIDRLAEIKSGRYGKLSAKRNTTIDELRTLWNSDRSWKRSLDADRFRWEYLIEFFGADRQLRTIEPDDVVALRDALQRRVTKKHGTKLMPATVNHALTLGKSAFNLAKKRKLIQANPFDDVKMLVMNNERDRVISDDDFNRILDRLDQQSQLCAIIAVETGMRRGEIQSLTRAQFDFDARTIRLHKTKTNEGRIVPLTRDLNVLLKEWCCQPNGRLFTMQASKMSMRFSQAARALGIEDVHFHDLRATWATRRLREGVSTLVVKRVLGHRSYRMVDRYARLVADDLHAALDAARERSENTSPQSAPRKSTLFLRPSGRARGIAKESTNKTKHRQGRRGKLP